MKLGEDIYHKVRGMQGEGKVIVRLGEGQGGVRARGSEVRGSEAEGKVG